MKKLLLVLFLLSATLSHSQNLPACDSLIITCCVFDSTGPNTLTIYADNYSSELFDYPGFMLFDSAMNIIAMETVNYFGIGTGPQPHTMDIILPLILPFNGQLNLYTGFYDSLACIFPFSISDTITGINDLRSGTSLEVFPNPASSIVNFRFGENPVASYFVFVSDVMGKEVMSAEISASSSLSLDNFEEGIFFLHFMDYNHINIGSRVLIVAKE